MNDRRAKAVAKAVILAAGAGRRVKSISRARPKSLLDLGGRPIIEWIITALRQAGIRDVVIVTGFRAGHLRRALGDGSRLGIGITYVHNRYWRKPNGISLYAARGAIRGDEAFLVVMSDHLLSPRIISSVAEAGTDRCLLAVDKAVGRVCDLPDATKVRTSRGRPVAIGKRLRRYDAVDCGLFRFDRRIFAALERAFKKGELSLSAGVKVLIEDGDLEVLPLRRERAWIDIDTPRTYRKALRDLRRFTRDIQP